MDWQGSLAAFPENVFFFFFKLCLYINVANVKARSGKNLFLPNETMAPTTVSLNKTYDLFEITN